MVGARIFLFFVMSQVKAGLTVWTTSLNAFGAGHVLGAYAWVKGTVQRRAAPRVQAWVVRWEHGDVESTVCARVLHAEPGAAPVPLPPEHGANVAGDADASMESESDDDGAVAAAEPVAEPHDDIAGVGGGPGAPGPVPPAAAVPQLLLRDGVLWTRVDACADYGHQPAVSEQLRALWDKFTMAPLGGGYRDDDAHHFPQYAGIPIYIDRRGILGQPRFLNLNLPKEGILDDWSEKQKSARGLVASCITFQCNSGMLTCVCCGCKLCQDCQKAQ